jgi:hypothetical protein
MNTSDNPSTLSRTVSWVVNDGDSNSLAVTSTVAINAGNDLPTAANSNVSMLKDSTYTFNINDFNYTDPDADIIASITVTSLEGVGSLKLNNNDVVANQVISKAAIDAGLLTFTPVSGQDGIGYDSFEFSVNDGQLDSLLSYVMTIDVQVAGDINGNGVIDVPGEVSGDIDNNGIIDVPGEIAGDINGNGVIDDPNEIAGDINGNGVIDDPNEVAGDINGNGVIDDPNEVAGDINGNGVIDDPNEIAGDINGNGVIDDPNEIAGDINGNGVIDDPNEIAGDINGNGVIDDPNEVAGDINGNGVIDDPNEVAGDINGNGIIDDPNEVAGDINGNGVIDDPSEVAGDINGNGVIDDPNEVAGDINGNGVIDDPNEVAGDINGNGVIDDPNEVAGDINGNGVIDNPNEVAGDINGNGVIDDPNEIAGDINGNGVIDDPNEITGDINGNGVIDDPNEVAGDINGNGVIDDPNEVAGDINGNGVIDDPNEIAGDINGNGVIDFPSEIQGLIDSINFYYEPVYQLITQDAVSGNYLITGSSSANGQSEAISNGNQVITANTALSGFINNSILEVFIPNLTSGSGSVDSPLINETVSNQSLKVGSVLSSDYIDVVIKGLEADNGAISVIRDGNRVDIYYEPESSFSGVADFALEIYQNKVLSDVKHFEITVNQNVDIIHENDMRQTATAVEREIPTLQDSRVSPEIDYKQTDLAIQVSDVDPVRIQSILNEFGKALDDRAPIGTLSDIASTAVKDALDTYSISETSSIVKGLLKQAIDAGESTVRIAAIASSMLEVSRESSYGSDIVIRNIIQQIVDSGLSTNQIAQILSTMLLNTDDQYHDDFILSIVSESNVTDLHLYQMKQILEQQDPELSDKLSKEVQMIRGNLLSNALDETDSQTNPSDKGLLAKLKDMLLGNRQTQAEETTSYDIKEHKYKIELAKAELLTMVRDESVNNNEDHQKR